MFKHALHLAAVPATLLLLLGGCKKEEEVEPKTGNASTTPIHCNCGTIVHDYGASQYMVRVENNCTGHEQDFILSPSVWFDANVGEQICFNNIQQW